MISVCCVKTGEKKVSNANIYQRRTSCVYMVDSFGLWRH